MPMRLSRFGYKWIVLLFLLCNMTVWAGGVVAVQDQTDQKTSCDTHNFVFKGKELILYGGAPDRHEDFLVENLTADEVLLVHKHAYRRTTAGWIQHIKPHEQAVLVIAYPRFEISCFTTHPPQTLKPVSCSTVLSGCAYLPPSRQANAALPTETRYFSTENTGAPVQN